MSDEKMRENELMAGAMDMLRNNLIEAGVIDSSVPPMFMTEAILGAIQKAAISQPAADPVGEIVTQPFGKDAKDICMIRWVGEYRPKQGDKLYATPSTAESDQQKLGFADGVKAAASLLRDQIGYSDADDAEESFRIAGILEIAATQVESLAPPTDAVTMTREEFSVMSGLVDDIDGLISESRGVSGLHMNGNDAPWSELESGGRFERLTNLDAARAIVAQHMPKEGK